MRSRVCTGHDNIDDLPLLFCPFCGGSYPITRECVCGATFEQQRRGRTRQFCSARCQSRMQMRKWRAAKKARARALAEQLPEVMSPDEYRMKEDE